MKINLDDLVGTQRDIAEIIGIESYISVKHLVEIQYISKNTASYKNLNAMLKSRRSTMDTTAVSSQESMICLKGM